MPDAWDFLALPDRDAKRETVVGINDLPLCQLLTDEI